MSRCRIPEFFERNKIDIGIYDPKSNRILPRNVKQRDICVHIHKNHYCVIWKKNRKDALFNGAEEIDKNFKYVQNNIKKNQRKQRIQYRFSKHETTDQLENVFVFDLDTHNEQEFAEAFTAGVYDVNRLRNGWDRDLTPNGIMLGKKMLPILMLLMESVT